MNRLTRLLTPLNSPRNSLSSYRRRRHHHHKIPYPSPVNLPLLPPPPPPPQKPISIAPQSPSPPSATLPPYLEYSSILPSLPPTQTTKLNSMDQSQPPPTDDFVHIENPYLSPRTDSLTDSIVNVANELNLDDVVSVQAEGEERRIELPEELSRSVMKLTCESHPGGGSCDVYVVGTAHVSQESCREVQEVIRFLKPQVVFLELCSSRVAVLAPQNLKVPTAREMIEMWKQKQNLFGILYSWFLAKVASRLEVSPGAEFRVAFEEARKCEAKVILGDRPVQITLRRTWAKMPLWHKTKLMYSLLFQAFFLPNPEDLDKMLKEMDDVDMLTLVIQEMSKEFPTLMETLVHERDQYMSSTLLKFASEHSSVVAVVGKGHMQGIKKHWKQPVVMKDLLELPSPTAAVSAGKVLISLGTAVAGVALISGIYLLWKK